MCCMQGDLAPKPAANGLSPVMNSSIARAAESGSEEDLDWSVPLDLQTLSSWEVAWGKRCCSANLSPSIF